METQTTGLLKGSEITIKCLELLGVDVVFAYPGGQAIELHQALSRSGMRVVLPRHEQGGAFAAGGYARASGRVGVCMATSGPGATNLVSGIADAYMDSIPTVFITGQVPSSMIGKNVFQETDIIGVTRPIVKHSFLVLDANDIPRIMREAFYIAQSGRPGPVVVDIPKNVQQQKCKVDFDQAPELKYYHPDPALDPAAVGKIKAMIAASKRPCIYAGGGIISADASEELVKFAESYNIPVVTTLMGIGAIPDSHPLSLRWLGMHGTVYANYAANECDLLLAFGARFDDRVTGNPKSFAVGAKIVHVDIDDSEINKNKPADLGVLADIREVLTKLNEAPEPQEYAEWFARIREWKKKYPFHYRNKPDHVQPQFVMETLSRLTRGQAVIVPGVGQHQMWAAQYYDYNYPRQLLTSGGLGAMGFGLPAAMGAKVACPEKTVINIDGDGSFQMNIQELGTLFVEEIPVKMIILDNQHLGMVAQWEDRFYNHNRGNTVLGRCKGSNGCGSGKNCDDCDGTRCTDRPYPDFVMIANGYGIPGRNVFTREELVPAIEEMLAADGPFLLDVHTGYEEHVLPMIPPGGDYTAIIME
ncbi:biosynthetic-type acetolactate synthase large subunit [Victivallis vadensis]|uniref:biosynthetic-type acetolactate synthase large subunit n=1 Tax=Victivallis vadensis TaxID=172901 RepID=UPI003AF66336